MKNLCSQLLHINKLLFVVTVIVLVNLGSRPALGDEHLDENNFLDFFKSIVYKNRYC